MLSRLLRGEREEQLGESFEVAGLEIGRRAGRELRELVIVCKTHTHTKTILHMHSCASAHDRGQLGQSVVSYHRGPKD